MKLCERCYAATNCMRHYLGPACSIIRDAICPEIQPNNAEALSDMSPDQMAKFIVDHLNSIQDAVLFTQSDIQTWLEDNYEF